MTTTVRGLLGATLAEDQVALVGNRLDKASLDSVTPPGGGLAVSGALECDGPVGTVMLRLTGIPLGTTTQTLSCAGNAGTPGSGTWSADLPTAADGSAAGGEENLSFSLAGTYAWYA
ncbi:hypothetical protein ACIA8F_21195 [Streptomyces sp. NPDC051563]|uniref:hypothetical protein n=1 Tax=Streptomyces sp. NPDC051563 TaxID=3365659 RepID=UPI0037B2F385